MITKRHPYENGFLFLIRIFNNEITAIVIIPLL